MDPFRAVAALYQPTPPDYISSALSAGKDGTRIRINVSAHQEKKENENTGKGEAKEKNKRLSAAFLQSFTEPHGEKMIGRGECPK